MDSANEIRNSDIILHLLSESIEKKRPLIQENICRWGQNKSPRYFWRTPDNNAYEVLIGELLIRYKYTNTIRINALFSGLTNCFNSAYALSSAKTEDLSCIIRDPELLQYILACQGVIQNLLKLGKGNIPLNESILLSITKLEDYSVRLVLSLGGNIPLAIANGDVLRMLSRLFYGSILSDDSAGLLNAIAGNLVFYGGFKLFSCSFLDLAETICAISNPLCSRCPVINYCDYYQQRISTPVQTGKELIGGMK